MPEKTLKFFSYHYYSRDFKSLQVICIENLFFVRFSVEKKSKMVYPSVMDFSGFEETRSDNPSDEEQMVFRYNRAERLKHAPKIVQDYYSGDFKPYKGGLFRSLISTRANKLLLATIIFTFGIIFFIRAFGPEKKSGRLSGVDISLSAFSYEDSVYASVKFYEASKKLKSDFEGGYPISALISAYDNEGILISEQKVTGKYEGNEIFLRTIFSDYDIMSIGAVCSMDDKLLKLDAPIEKR